MLDYVVRAPSQLGTLLAGFRKARGLSQQSLATKLGSTQQAVSLMERAAAPVSLERLMKALAALDVELVLRDTHAAAVSGRPRRPRTSGW
jgi:HTH-type transcriptional regulator/antitoxin HipB